MRSNALKMTRVMTAPRTEKRQKPSLVFVALNSEEKAAPTNTSPDFEEFMNHYGMWSDFA